MWFNVKVLYETYLTPRSHLGLVYEGIALVLHGCCQFNWVGVVTLPAGKGVTPL